MEPPTAAKASILLEPAAGVRIRDVIGATRHAWGGVLRKLETDLAVMLQEHGAVRPPCLFELFRHAMGSASDT